MCRVTRNLSSAFAGPTRLHRSTQPARLGRPLAAVAVPRVAWSGLGGSRPSRARISLLSRVFCPTVLRKLCGRICWVALQVFQFLGFGVGAAGSVPVRDLLKTLRLFVEEFGAPFRLAPLLVAPRGFGRGRGFSLPLRGPPLGMSTNTEPLALWCAAKPSHSSRTCSSLRPLLKAWASHSPLRTAPSEKGVMRGLAAFVARSGFALGRRTSPEAPPCRAESLAAGAPLVLADPGSW